MPTSALYFPYMSVPRTPAIWGVLLYWDELGTIVPADAAGWVDPWTQALIDTELVRPVDPFVSMNFASWHRFAEGLAELLDSVSLRPRDLPPVSIHIEKGDESSWEVLRERGLIHGRGGPGHDRNWVSVEGYAGSIFLTYLAAHLAMRSEVPMEPITDQQEYFAALDGFGSLQVAAKMDEARRAILRGILPLPVSDIDPRVLAEFKHKHRESLRRFRRYVEDVALRSAQAQNEEIRQRIASDAGIALRDQADELRARFKETRWPTKDGAVCALLSGASGAAGGIASGKPVVAVTAGLAPTVIEFVRRRLVAPAEKSSPAAYAVLAEGVFGR